MYDLAQSAVFAVASSLVEANVDPSSPWARYGAPGGALGAAASGVPVGELADKELDVLAAFSAPGSAEAAAAALGVGTVRDLACWPPYIAARTALRQQIAPVDEEDNEVTPPDLLPAAGKYPTERVFYSTLLIDRIADKPAKDLSTSGPIDLTDVEDHTGFGKPAEGALLTYSQSWYTEGLALGQLLHSLALAPGEATRVSMLDWTRRVTGQRDETGAQTEALTNTTTHTRAVNEVAQAVAVEAQSGFSKSTVNATSTQEGSASGGPQDLDLLRTINPFNLLQSPKLESTSKSTATNNSVATSFSSSNGRRDVRSESAQNISDATHQAAHSSRERRATVVEEVQESEVARGTTRVVANYNHMHALTVSYYEVVQLFRTVIALERVERVLFVPLRLYDFAAPNDLSPSQKVSLAQFSLSDEVTKALVFDPDEVIVEPTVVDPLAPLVNPVTAATTPAGGGLVALPDSNTLTAALGENARIYEDRGLVVPTSATIRHMTTVGVPDGAEIVVRMRDGATTAFTVDDNAIELGDGLEWSGVVDIGVKAGDAPIAQGAIVSLQNSDSPGSDLSKSASMSISIGATDEGGTQTIVKASRTNTLSEAALRAHLQQHRLYYNQILFRSLDAASLALLLSPYVYGDRPLLEVIDPTPVTVAGNYLVFRMPTVPDPEANTGTPARTWADWLDDHDLLDEATGALVTGTLREDIIPLPSGGVFAEAVLGRSNSAEKLDMTRFWNWQDSPIPIEPPDIQPLSLDSRTQGTDLKPGDFSSPLVNIVARTTLPDPQGTSAILDALATNNLFRDMSGLVATIGLTGSALDATSDQAQQAAAQAGENFKTTADLAKTLAALALSAYLKTPVGGPAQENISNSGAALNQAKKTGKATTGGSDDGGGPSGSPGGGAAPGSASANGASAPATTEDGLEVDALRSAGVADHSGGGTGGGSSPLGQLLSLIQSASPTASAAHYTTKNGVVLAPAVAAAIGRVADEYFAATGKKLHITSGTRTPAEQASAMYEKLAEGGNFDDYENQVAAGEIAAEYDATQPKASVVAAMTAVIDTQIANGVYISKHLLAGAVDVRITDMTADQKDAFKEAVAAEGSFRSPPLEEKKPPHWHLQLL